MTLPKHVTVVDVSPRDGLQNERAVLPTATKIELINQLGEAGLSVIEVTSFVSAKWVPALADGAALMAALHQRPGIRYPVLVPNVQGFEAALAAGAKEIAVFTTPSELFSQKNTHCTVAESLDRLREVIRLAKAETMRVRGYVSCVMGCPYEGEMAAHKVAALSEQLLSMGCDEISLGDTIGVGTPLKTDAMLTQVMRAIPVEKIAVHFHDTYGLALTNVYVALQHGVTIVDASVAGLGGCPYAKGASGNVATEDVVYFLQSLGISTGIDLKKLINTGRFIAAALGRVPQSRVNLAMGD